MRYAKQLVFSFFLGAISFIYFNSLSTTVFGGDTGDLLSAILTKSFAHPPGYPFYILLGLLFKKIFFSLEFIQRISLISTLSTLISFFVLYKIFLLLEPKLNFQKISLFVLSLFVIGVNYVIWLYSIVPEVFALNALIITLIYYFAIKIYKGKGEKKYLFYLIFLIGLGISHHHTFLLVLPSVFYLISSSKRKLSLTKREYLWLMAALFFGILPLIFLPIASFLNSEVIWGDATTLKGFLDILLRKGYGTFVAGVFVTKNPYHRVLQLKNIFNYLVSDFTLPVVILITIGIYALIKDKSKLAQAYLLNLFFFGPFFFFYANFPLSTPFMFATLERFLFIFYIFLVFPLYFGLKTLIDLISTTKIISELSKKIVVIFIYLVVFLILAVVGFRNYQSIKYLKTDKTAEKFGEEILSLVPSNSLILLSQDTVLFNTQYVYFYNKYFLKKPMQGKILMHFSKLYFPFYFKVLKKHYPNLIISKNYSPEDFILKNSKKFSVFSNVKIHLNDKSYEWKPYGLLFKLTKTTTKENNSEYLSKLEKIWKNSYGEKLLVEKEKKPLKFKNLFTYYILQYYAIAWQNTAYIYLKNRKYGKAIEYIQKAKKIYPEDPDADYLLAVYYYKKNNCNKAFTILKNLIKLRKDPLYFSLAKEIKSCVSPENREKITNILRKFTDTKLSEL